MSITDSEEKKQEWARGNISGKDVNQYVKNTPHALLQIIQNDSIGQNYTG